MSDCGVMAIASDCFCFAHSALEKCLEELCCRLGGNTSARRYDVILGGLSIKYIEPQVCRLMTIHSPGYI